MSTADAGLVFGGFAVVTGLLGTYLGGWMTEKLTKGGIHSAGVWVSALSLLLSAPVVAMSLNAGDLNLTYLLLFMGMLLLFFNTGPMNAILVSCLPASIRATGVAMNVLIIHLLGDALSPQLVTYLSLPSSYSYLCFSFFSLSSLTLFSFLIVNK